MVQRPRPERWTDKLKDTVALVVAPENRRLALGWLLCVIVVIAIGLRSTVDTNSFVGIADSRESIVNFDFPVNVDQINVISGQAVHKGDLVAQLDQPELELKIQEARASLAKLQAQQKLVDEMGQMGNLRASGVQGDASANPLATEIKNLNDQISVLEAREKSLYVFAPFDGVVGSVNYKKGETVKPYEPLLTVAPATPTYVDAFIHEALQTTVTTGSTVTVQSMTDTSKSIEGRVVSMGSRIVELPVRIGRMQSTKMWGRELMIEIPEKNPFLLGEKVAVSRPFLQVSFPIARASDRSVKPHPAPIPQTPAMINLPATVKALDSFEPSGAVYLKDLKKFVVVSDDTDASHSPMMFLLSRDGAVDSNVPKVQGLKEIHDLESIFEDTNGDLYLLSSQTPNKKGEVRRDRDLLIRVKRQGIEFTATGQAELRPLVLNAIKASGIDVLLKAGADKDIEIEGAYLDKGLLHVALKRPLLADQSSALLTLGPIAKIIDSGKIAAEDFKLDQRIVFPATDVRETRISDMEKIGNKLVITTISKKPAKVGRLWAMNMATGTLEKIGEYPGHSPEAVAYDSDNKELMVLFDEKDKPALYMRNNSIDFN